jgi:hypothetical protein
MARSLDERLDDPVEQPRLVIEPAVWRQIMAWATVTNSEVSGMALLEPEAADDLRLTRVFLLPQLGNAVATQLDPVGMADLMGQLLDEGIDPSGLRVWWHSHGREAPFWSGQDEQTIEGFAPSSMVSLVVDHRQRRLARLDRYRPRHTTWLAIEGADAIEDWAESELEAARTAVRETVGSLAGEARLRPGSDDSPGT